VIGDDPQVRPIWFCAGCQGRGQAVHAVDKKMRYLCEQKNSTTPRRSRKKDVSSKMFEDFAVVSAVCWTSSSTLCCIA
jgi:hypothetical protein